MLDNNAYRIRKVCLIHLLFFPVYVFNGYLNGFKKTWEELPAIEENYEKEGAAIVLQNRLESFI